MKKIYFLIGLCLLNFTVFAQLYYPNGASAPYGGTAQTVCEGTQNDATTISYSVCGTSAPGSALTVSPQWYLNGDIVYTGAAFNALAGGGTVTLPAGAFTYTSPGAYTDTNGLKCVLTWTGASPAACGSVTIITGDTTDITVNASPLSITGYASACKTLTTSLSDVTPGGLWTSSNTSIAQVGSATGLVNGIAAGTAQIVYTLPNTCNAVITVTVTPSPPPAGITGTNVVCVGQTTALSQASGAGYFSTSDITEAAIDSFTGVVTGVQMGTPVISYTIGTGCITTISLTVHPAGPITGIDSICKESTTYLANIVGGGTWSSSFGGIATIDTGSGFVTGTNGGQSTIYYTNPYGCIDSLNMTVILIPSAITGVTHTCPGASTTLSDAAIGGVWSSNDNSTATVSASTGKVHGVFADTVTIFYTVQPGCSNSTVVTVNPLPAPIVGNDVLCATIIDTLYDATGGGTWSSLTASIASVIDTSGIVTALSQGNAIIAYTLPITGCRRTDTILVHPSPVPVINYSFFTETFYVDSIYTSYQWHDSAQGLIPGATSPSLAALYTEYYYIVVTDTFGCVGTSAWYHFDASILGIGDPANSLIKVYPNPAMANLHISSPVNVRAVITGIDGKVQMEQTNAKDMNISQLPGGLYFITLYDDKQQAIAVRKVVKE